MKKKMAVLLVLVLVFTSMLGLMQTAQAGNPDWPTIRLIARKLGEGDPVNPILAILEEKIQANIEIDWRAPSDYGQQGQVILASGDYPDMMEVWWTNPPGDFDDFADSGLIIPVDELVQQYGANILAVRPDNSWWAAPDGQHYAIPCRYAEMADETMLIRQDWLDALGLAMPTTLDELAEVVKQFTIADPDGNGVDDTYGIGKAGGYNSEKHWLAAYGVAHNQWNVTPEGDLIWWGVMPEAYEATIAFRELYQAGYVEPEFPLMSRSEMISNMARNMYGVQWWQPTQMTLSTSDFWREFITNVPQADIAVLPPMTVEGVAQPTYPGVAYLQFINMIIFKDAPHPEKCVELLNYLASPEGWDLAVFGIEGEHWDDVDGKVVARQMTTEEYKASGAGLYAWFCRPGFYPRNTDDLAMEAILAYDPYIVRNPMPYGTDLEIKRGAALKGDLTGNVFTKLIVEKDIDTRAVWDEYVQTWNTSGGAEMTAEVSAEYKRISGLE